MDWGKWAFAAFLLFWVVLSLFGAWQKLRDGEVGWKGNNRVSRREGPDQFGYWFSIGFNFVLAAGALALMVAILTGQIPITWGPR